MGSIPTEGVVKKESEVKFFVDDLGVIRKKLRKLDAKFECRVSEHDFHLDTTNQDLKKKNSSLRIRKSALSFLTYKTKIKSRKGLKVADEHQITIGDAIALLRIFKHLGFKVVFEYKKPAREYWKYFGSYVTLDSFPFGKFVEVEGSPKKIKQIGLRLGLNFAKTSAKSYRKLLEEYRKYKKITYWGA